MLQETSSPAERGPWPRPLRSLLFSTTLLDELIAGFLFIPLPLIRDDLALSYAQVGLLLVIGEISSMICDPLINLASDRGSKRLPILLGMFGLAFSFALAASAQSFGWLLLAMALLYPAGTAAVGLSQAALIDQHPQGAERTMTRWTIMGAIGDLLSPLAVALALLLGTGWRELYWLAGAGWLLAGCLCMLQRFPRTTKVAATGDQEEPELGALAALRLALRNARLLRWVAVLMIIELLDEIFLGFASLYLSDVLGAQPEQISLALGALMVGGLLGLFGLERGLARRSGERLLPWLALLTLAGIGALLLARSLWLASAALFVVGVGAAGIYPIAQAAAYRALPGRSGTVLAVGGLRAPFVIVAPLLLGLAANAAGVLAAMALLGLAPLGVLLLRPRASVVQEGVHDEVTAD